MVITTDSPCAMLVSVGGHEQHPPRHMDVAGGGGGGGGVCCCGIID